MFNILLVNISVRKVLIMGLIMGIMAELYCNWYLIGTIGILTSQLEWLSV